MISIVVPVYNVEPYLRECLDSVINQTFTDWEGVLVDDGSTDNSGSICDEYAQRDQRFRVIHQANQGPAAARNTGLREFKGDYMASIDSDDFVHPLWLETLHKIITENDCDVAEVGMKKFTDNPVLTANDAAIGEAVKIPKDKNVEMLYEEAISPSVSNKMFRRSIIGDTTFHFNNGEDWDFNLQILLKGAQMYQSPTPLYYYRIRQGSITSGYTNDFFIDNVLVKANIYEHFMETSGDQRYQALILGHLYRILTTQKKAVIYHDYDGQRTDDVIREVYDRTYADFKHCNGIPASIRLQAQMLYHCPRLFEWLTRLKKRFLK